MEELEKLRKRLRWTQEKLGQFLGYTGRAPVSNIETGKDNPGGAVRRLIELLKLYGADAPKLWDKQWARKIKKLFKDEDGDG